MSHLPKHDQPKEHMNLWAFGSSFIVGWLIIGYGLLTMFQHRSLTNPTYSFEFAFGANILHDAVAAPVVFVTGYVIRRVTPAWLRGTVMWAFFASIITLLVAYVPLRGFGRESDNPSLLPLNYATGTITVLVVIWVIALAVGTLRFFRRP